MTTRNFRIKKLISYYGFYYTVCENFINLDNRLKKYAQERKELLEEITKLKFELEEERMKSSSNCFGLMNGSDAEDFDESSKLLILLLLEKNHR